MAVRNFNGGSDTITLDGGTLGALFNGAFTLVMIGEPLTVGVGGIGSDSYLIFKDSGNQTLADLFMGAGASGSGKLAFGSVLDLAEANVNMTGGDWQAYGCSHPAGTNPLRFHRKELGAGSWSHVNSGASVSNNAGLVDTIRIVGFKDVRIDAFAVFTVELNDAAWETIQTTPTTQQLVDLGALEVWDLNQLSAATPVLGLLGTGADQTAITGTTVITGDDPTWTSGLIGPPVNIVVPVASPEDSDVEVGAGVVVSDGAWSGSPAPTFTYQWQRDTAGANPYANISAATSNVYTLTEDDQDCHVRCVVTATNTEGTASETTNALGPVVPAPPLEFTARFSGGAANAAATASLGGAESSVEVGANLFDTISAQQGNDGHTDYRCVYIHNDDSAPATITAWVDSSAAFTGSDYLAIAVADEAAGVTVETIPNETTAPSGPTFSTPTTVETALDMGTIDPGEGRGLWLRRTTPSSTPADPSNPARIVFTVTPL